MEKIWIPILIIVISALFLTFYTGKVGVKVRDEKYCTQDGDCVPAQCCHPTDCVNLDHKPDCKGIFCTMECKPGTMDCGQGYCACVNDECTAIIK